MQVDKGRIIFGLVQNPEVINSKTKMWNSLWHSDYTDGMRTSLQMPALQKIFHQLMPMLDLEITRGGVAL
jgi:hypothetical protein